MHFFKEIGIEDISLNETSPIERRFQQVGGKARIGETHNSFSLSNLFNYLTVSGGIKGGVLANGCRPWAVMPKKGEK